MLSQFASSDSAGPGGTIRIRGTEIIHVQLQCRCGYACAMCSYSTGTGIVGTADIHIGMYGTGNERASHVDIAKYDAPRGPSGESTVCPHRSP